MEPFALFEASPRGRLAEPWLQDPAGRAGDLTSSRRKAARFIEIVRLFIGDISGRAGLIDNDMINHACIACAHIINPHVRAGFDRGLDHLAVLVHNVTGSV